MWIAYYYRSEKHNSWFLVTVIDSNRRVLTKQTNEYMNEQYGTRGEGWKTVKEMSLLDVPTAIGIA